MVPVLSPGTRAVEVGCADPLFVAMALAVAILAASMFSVEVGLSVSIIEIVLGVALGNTLHLTAPAS
jgi:L-cysteine desulfidase